MARAGRGPWCSLLHDHRVVNFAWPCNRRAHLVVSRNSKPFPSNALCFTSRIRAAAPAKKDPRTFLRALVTSQTRGQCAPWASTVPNFCSPQNHSRHLSYHLAAVARFCRCASLEAWAFIFWHVSSPPIADPASATLVFKAASPGLWGSSTAWKASKLITRDKEGGGSGPPPLQWHIYGLKLLNKVSEAPMGCLNNAPFDCLSLAAQRLHQSQAAIRSGTEAQTREV